MPTYEYQREDGTTFEMLQRFSDKPLVACPETGQRVKRIIGGGAGLIFKGSGFYLTDYARKGNGSGNGKATSEASGSSSSTEGSGEKSGTPPAAPASE